MARVELPQSKIKARKRRRRNRITAVAVVAVLVLFGLSIALFRAPFLRVTAIAVTGAQTLNAEEIKQFVQQRIAGTYGWVYPKDDILLYPQTLIEHDLAAAYPVLKLVEVHADNFHTIGVVLHERQPAALWCAVDCYVMDENGVVYAPAQGTSTDQYVAYGGATVGEKLPKQYLTLERFQALAALVAALSQVESGNKVRQVIIDEMGDARAYFQNDFVLIFSNKDQTGDVFERLSLARKAAPLEGKSLGDFEYIDLRFGDKLYYKPKSE
jgi:cell division septal protein FtsQ